MRLLAYRRGCDVHLAQAWREVEAGDDQRHSHVKYPRPAFLSKILPGFSRRDDRDPVEALPAGRVEDEAVISGDPARAFVCRKPDRVEEVVTIVQPVVLQRVVRCSNCLQPIAQGFPFLHKRWLTKVIYPTSKPKYSGLFPDFIGKEACQQSSETPSAKLWSRLDDVPPGASASDHEAVLAACQCRALDEVLHT